MNTYLSKLNYLPNVKSAKNIKTVKFESVLPVNFQRLIISYSSNFGVTKSDPNVSMIKTLNFFNAEQLKQEFKKHGFDEKEVGDRNMTQTLYNLSYLFPMNGRILYHANTFMYNAEEKSMTIVAKPYVPEGVKFLEPLVTEFQDNDGIIKKKKVYPAFFFFFLKYQQIDENNVLFSQV